MTATIDPKNRFAADVDSDDLRGLLQHRSDGPSCRTWHLVCASAVPTGRQGKSGGEPDPNTLRRQYYWCALVSDVMYSMQGTVAALRDALSTGLRTVEDTHRSADTWSAIVQHWFDQTARKIMYPQNLEDFYRDLHFVADKQKRSTRGQQLLAEGGRIATILQQWEEALYGCGDLVNIALNKAVSVSDDAKDCPQHGCDRYRTSELLANLKDLANLIAREGRYFAQTRPIG